MKEKIIVKNLHKSFHDLDVLKGIDLTVTEGEVVCIIGPSGSGKSTMLRCLNRLEQATKGTIIVDDITITDKHVNINHVRENIGMVFQSFNLFAHRTILDNVTMGPIEVLRKPKKEAEEEAMELLRRFNEQVTSFMTGE